MKTTCTYCERVNDLSLHMSCVGCGAPLPLLIKGDGDVTFTDCWFSTTSQGHGLWIEGNADAVSIIGSVMR